MPRTQSGDGVIRLQSVPPLLPAYNRYMGGVDRGMEVSVVHYIRPGGVDPSAMDNLPKCCWGNLRQAGLVELLGYRYSNLT